MDLCLSMLKNAAVEDLDPQEQTIEQCEGNSDMLFLSTGLATRYSTILLIPFSILSTNGTPNHWKNGRNRQVSWMYLNDGGWLWDILLRRYMFMEEKLIDDAFLGNTRIWIHWMNSLCKLCLFISSKWHLTHKFHPRQCYSLERSCHNSFVCYL